MNKYFVFFGLIMSNMAADAPTLGGGPAIRVSDI